MSITSSLKVNGQTFGWFSLSENVDQEISCMVNYQGSLVVAGSFTNVGEQSFNNIASWDGSGWSGLGSGYPSFGPSSIKDMTAINDSLIVVGYEVNSSDLSIINKVVVWDGFSWTQLGANANNTISCVEIFNNEIYVGGKFDSIDNVAARGIAKWNGISWEGLGNGLRYNGGFSDVSDLCAFDNKLFATGFIDSAGTIACNSTAYWDGTNWGTIPCPFTYVYFDEMIEYDGFLLFGSLFNLIGSDLDVEIYKWDGTSFSVFSHQFMSNVLDFAIFDGNLYSGGADVEGNYGSTVRKWNGSTWDMVGAGLNDEVHSLCGFNSDLYAGGNFSATFELGSEFDYLARYTELNSTLENRTNYLQIYPNPVHSEVTILFNGSLSASAYIDIRDIYGRNVLTKQILSSDTFNNLINCSVEGLCSGLYFVFLIDGDTKAVQKFVKK